jgi:hypothetical protein
MDARNRAPEHILLDWQDLYPLRAQQLTQMLT